IIDSMVNQHAKWLEKCKTEVPWRAPISSFEYFAQLNGLAPGS
ncbi:Xylulose 5-phosphate/Fructose 6-phosphate phosphoketolase, partial [mine drainage metagenome]